MMKKNLCYILIPFLLAACRNSNKTEAGPETTIIKEPAKQEQVIAATEEKNRDEGALKSAIKKSIPAEESKVTFIELGSVGCIPCKMMQPIMDEIEKEYAGQVKVIFYDVWKPAGRPYAQKYKIRAIPTQVFLDKTGNEYYRHTGYFPKEELVKILKMRGVN